MLGPNVRKLIAYKVSLDGIPVGSKDPLADGANFLLDRERFKAAAASAASWVANAMEAVRRAAPPNPWTMSSDEDIAGFLLEEIKKRRAKDESNLSDVPSGIR